VRYLDKGEGAEVLRADAVACARGGVPVLAGVSFTVAAGQALVLRGPNGSGKTTLLRCVAGLQPVEAGRIEGAGERVAYAGHADGIKAQLTVAENLDFWAGVHGVTGIAGALAAYRLEGLADRPARALSAGQKRRLGLARMLVTGRPVWVMDEPTVSLDAEAVGLFADAVRGHLAAGGSALVATHIDLGLAAAVLDVAPFRVRSGGAGDPQAGAFEDDRAGAWL
jgi:heme exporter protein A